MTKVSECDSEITSLALRGDGHQFFIGTAKSQVYRVQLAEWKMELLNTCHNSVINDIAFPFGSAELFATCAHEDIRVWHSQTNQELLRIKVFFLILSSRYLSKSSSFFGYIWKWEILMCSSNLNNFYIIKSISSNLNNFSSNLILDKNWWTHDWLPMKILCYYFLNHKSIEQWHSFLNFLRS